MNATVRRAALTIGMVAAALAAAGCTGADASERWPAGAGRVRVDVTVGGIGDTPFGVHAGALQITASGRSERQPFAVGVLDDGLSSTSIGIGAWFPDRWWQGAPFTVGCDPAQGPVTLTAALETFQPKGGAKRPAWAFTAAPSVTVDCAADWEWPARFRFDLQDPRAYGRMTVRAVLVDPPAATDRGVVALWTDPPYASPARTPEPESLTLTRQGDALVGERTVDCRVGRPFVVALDVGSLSGPDLAEADIWAAWPPPARVTTEAECVAGELRELEVELAARTSTR